MNSLVFHFKAPEYLWGLIIVPILLIVFWLSLYHTQRRLRKFGEDALISRITPNNSKTKPYFKFIFLMMALVCIILHLSGPVFSYRKPVRFPADIFFLVDVSNSMLAEDIYPSRLKYAQSILIKGLEELKDCRIGLIPFAGQSFIDVPLTRNKSALLDHIESLNPQIISAQGTLISEALLLAVNSFPKKNDRSQIILLLTDGENHEPQANSLFRLIKSNHIHLQILGIGNPSGAKIPYPPGKLTFLRDNKGNTVITKPNPQLLSELAQSLSGSFSQINPTNSHIPFDLEKWIEPSRVGSQEQIKESRFPSFLGLGLLFLILEFVLFERKNRGWKQTLGLINGKTVLVMLLFLGFFNPLKSQDILWKEGAKAYLSGNFKEAETRFRNLLNLQNRQEKVKILYNLGLCFYQEGNWKGADTFFNQALARSEKNKEFQSRIWFNLGGSAYNQGKWPQSIQNYINCLRLNPKDSDALYNLAWVRWKMKHKPPPLPPPLGVQEENIIDRERKNSLARASKRKIFNKPHLERRKGTGGSKSSSLTQNW